MLAGNIFSFYAAAIVPNCLHMLSVWAIRRKLEAIIL